MAAYRWTKFRLAVKAMLTEHGQTAEEVMKTMEHHRREAAKAQGWRKSELACTLAADKREIEEVARRVGLQQVQ